MQSFRYWFEKAASYWFEKPFKSKGDAKGDFPLQQKKTDSGNAQYDPAKSGISTVADTAGELVKEMVYMNWQFLSADYYTM